jgi:hypothetical protein
VTRDDGRPVGPSIDQLDGREVCIGGVVPERVQAGVAGVGELRIVGVEEQQAVDADDDGAVARRGGAGRAPCR